MLKRGEDRVQIRTHEGTKAVQEAIDFLKKAPVVPTQLKWNDTLALAAKAHVDDTGSKGLMQHESSEGKTARERI